ncbi:MAG TPA: hypothetical protein VNM16_01730 [Bacillota bacterium]|nr:hypothetical protein [Bacillota bacterium]
MTVVGVRRAAVALALVALGGSMAALAGCGSAANVVSAADVGSAPKVVEQSLKIVNGDQPVYSPAYWTAKAGDIVVLTITSNDDGTAPLLPGSPYATVQGTVDGTELVNGKATTSLPVDQVAHTFTVPALGINLAIPASPTGGTVTVQATIHITKAGVYYWHCNAPCGTDPNGLGGAMASPGMMEGTITVQG